MARSQQVEARQRGAIQLLPRWATGLAPTTATISCDASALSSRFATRTRPAAAGPPIPLHLLHFSTQRVDVEQLRQRSRLCRVLSVIEPLASSKRVGIPTGERMLWTSSRSCRLSPNRCSPRHRARTSDCYNVLPACCLMETYQEGCHAVCGG